VAEEVEEEPATEIDPITGIYRLKPKAKPEEEQQDASDSHGESHGHSNGSEDSAFQSAFTNNTFNYEKPFESSSYGQDVEQGAHESDANQEQYTQLTLAAPSSDDQESDQQD
jgi:hypothetical protein